MGSVLAAGSIIMDIVATAPRFPRAGETVLGEAVRFFPGGKGANQAVAAARLGAQARMIGCAGGDAFGQQMRAFLEDEGVDLRHVRTAGAPTGVGIITLAQSNNTIVVAPGANSLLSVDDLRGVTVERGDVLVAQLEIPLATVEAFLRKGRERGAVTILNAAPAVSLPRDFLALADILVVNESELEMLAGGKLVLNDDLRDVFEAAAKVRAAPGQIICATLGERGHAALIGETRIAQPARKVAVTDVTGAGDCFVGALAGELVRGAAIAYALRFANAAASLCVQRAGAGPSMPSRAEVEAILS